MQFLLQKKRVGYHQFFICNRREIAPKLKDLTKTGTSTDGWTDSYIDKNTKECRWLTRYSSEYHGGGVIVLKRQPEPAIGDLINVAMTSFDTNDIIGASLELLGRERHNKEEFRDKLLNRLLQADTKKVTDFEKERLKIIIYESDLYDATNRRNIVGKHFTEMQSDAGYYRAIAQRAMNILADIK